MADETPAPAVPEAAPVAAPEPAPAPVETPPVETPAPEPPTPEAPAETPAETPPAEPEAPAQEPAVDPKPDDPAPEVKAEAPVYTDFKLPEGIQAPAERIAEFTGVLGKYGLSQEAGQELMDLHGAALKQVADATSQHQIDAFEETRKGWREDFFRTAGAKADALANDAKWAIGQLVPNADARKELHAVLGFTGVGDHPAVINLLAAAAKKMRERSAPATPLQPKGAPATPWDARYNRPGR